MSPSLDSDSAFAESRAFAASQPAFAASQPAFAASQPASLSRILQLCRFRWSVRGSSPHERLINLEKVPASFLACIIRRGELLFRLFCHYNGSHFCVLGRETNLRPDRTSEGRPTIFLRITSLLMKEVPNSFQIMVIWLNA